MYKAKGQQKGETMQCELCGKTGQMFLAEIEGSELIVCKECASFGRIIKPVREEAKESAHEKAKAAKKQLPANQEEITLAIVDGYAKKIKQKRESLGLKQKELARILGEKESKIHKIESGHYEPPIWLARKIESKLGIKLIEKINEKSQGSTTANAQAMTIGDLLLMKRKEKKG